MSRPTLNEYFLDIAELTAKRSTCERGQVGAVLVQDKHVVGLGYNGSPPGLPHCENVGCLEEPGREGCQRTIHAEQNAINFAARKGIALEGAALYCTHSPCLSCAKSIISAGIDRVVARNPYRITDGAELLQEAGIVYREMLPLEQPEPKFTGPEPTDIEATCKICGAPITHVTADRRSLICGRNHHVPNPAGPVTVGQDNFRTADR